VSTVAADAGADFTTATTPVASTATTADASADRQRRGD
jgi:hypothetical protein